MTSFTGMVPAQGRLADFAAAGAVVAPGLQGILLKSFELLSGKFCLVQGRGHVGREDGQVGHVGADAGDIEGLPRRS